MKKFILSIVFLFAIGLSVTAVRLSKNEDKPNDDVLLYKSNTDSIMIDLCMTYYRAGWISGSNAAGSLERAGSLDSAGLAEAWELDSLNLINLINDEMEKNAETPR